VLDSTLAALNQSSHACLMNDVRPPSRRARPQPRSTAAPFKARSVASIAALLGAQVALASCSWITGADDDRYRVRVDSISAPTSIRPTDTLRVVLYGDVGRDGCYEFDRIEARRFASSVELTVCGAYVGGPEVACVQIVTKLHESYAIPPPLSNPFTVAVRQPDGSRLEREVRVE